MAILDPAYAGGYLLRANTKTYPAWGRLSEALRTGRPQVGNDFEQIVDSQCHVTS
jgi:hypothetical protein